MQKAQCLRNSVGLTPKIVTGSMENISNMATHTLQMDNIAEAPFSSLNTVEPKVVTTTRSDGVIVLRDPRELSASERSIVAFLRNWSEATPERIMLAKRGLNGDWIQASYGQIRRDVDAVAQSLLDHNISPGQTILILSENSIEHAILALAAMTVGIAVAPISPSYSLSSSGAVKLRRVFDAVRPAMIFAQEWRRFEPAIHGLDVADIPVVAVSDMESSTGVLRFSEFLAATPSQAVEDAYSRTEPDTVAKILFSSGSTGWPKGVINTQRMMCANMAMVDSMWGAEERNRPSVTLHWMPWNHTMAGNGLFNRSLRQGGTYYINDGRPLAGEFQKTIRNLSDLSPNSYSDVPSGFAMLAAALEEDDKLLERFFRNLAFVQYAGASLPDELWRRFQRLAVRATGERIPFLSGYGCTETGPLITQLYWPVEGSGFIGLPVPGIEVKLIPVDATRYELRARGPNLTPGYIGEPELSAAAFDDEGFYRTGDAVTFVDRSDPLKGLRFASRVAEDFKLLTGTFVAVGTLRSDVISALMPLVMDLVVTGQDRPFVGGLIWPDIAACRRLLGDREERLTVAELIGRTELTAAIRAGLAKHNQIHCTSSTRIGRVMLLEELPSAEANEITEKGYINQQMVLERRAKLVDTLYAEPADSRVIFVDG